MRRRDVVTAILAGALAIAVLAGPALAQQDSTRQRADVGGTLTVTSKGISTIPSFTLGRPAAMLDVSVARNGLSFEPQFRAGLDGKPWSVILWGRYRLVRRERLRVDLGGHPSLNFRTTRVTTGGVSRDVIVARRYLAGELGSTWWLARNVGIGPYYLYSRGLEQDVARNTHFVSLRATISAPLPGRLVARLTPQAYFLKTDALRGTYGYAGLTVSKRGFPLSASTVVNRVIRTDLAGERLLWNVNLHYAIR